MQVLKEITLDKVINLYEGQVVHDKKQLIEWDDHRRTPLYELKERTLAQDKMILGAAETRQSERVFRRRIKEDTPYRLR